MNVLKKICAVNTTGVQTDQVLVSIPATSAEKIHLHYINLDVAGATSIEVKIGSTVVYRQTLAGAGTIAIEVCDLYTTERSADLKLSVGNNVAVIGCIQYSLQ